MKEHLQTPSLIETPGNYTQQIFTKYHAHIEEFLTSKFSTSRTLTTFHDNIMIHYIKHAVTNSLNFRPVLIIFRNKSQNTGYVNLIPVFSSLLSLLSNTENKPENKDKVETTPQYRVECYKSILTVFRNYQMFLLEDLVNIYSTTIHEMFITSAEHFKSTYLKRFSENFLILERMQSYVPEKDFLKFYDVYRTVRLSIFTEYIKLGMYQHAYRLITPLLYISNKNEINIFDSFEKEDLELFFSDIEAVQRQQFNLLGLSCLELERHKRKHGCDLIKGALYILCNRDLSNRFESKLPVEREAEENVYKIITEEKKKFEHKNSKNKDFILISENMDVKTLIEEYIKELKTLEQNETVRTVIEVLEYIVYPGTFLTNNIVNLVNNKDLLGSLSSLQIDNNVSGNLDRLIFLIAKTTIYKMYEIIMSEEDEEMVKEELYELLCIEEDIEESELLSLATIDKYETKQHDTKQKNCNHYGSEFCFKYKFFDFLFMQQIDIKKYIILLLISVSKHLITITEDGIKLRKIVSNIRTLEGDESTDNKSSGTTKDKKEELNIEDVKKEIFNKGLNVFKDELKRGYYNLMKFHNDNTLNKREFEIDEQIEHKKLNKEDKATLKIYLNTENDCENQYKEDMELFINEVNGRLNEGYKKEIEDFNRLASEIRHMKNTTLFTEVYLFNMKKQTVLEMESKKNKTKNIETYNPKKNTSFGHLF